MERKRISLPRERKVLYVGSANRDLEDFPAKVKTEVATAIEVARMGGKHHSAKPWRGLGPQVYEIVQDDGDAYRTVYTVQFKEAVYVLHAFQKKSKHGIKTPQREVEMIERRLKAAEADYRERFDEKKKRG